MNHIAHRTLPLLSTLATAAIRRYAPFLGCLSCVSMMLYVVSGLHF